MGRKPIETIRKGNESIRGKGSITSKNHSKKFFVKTVSLCIALILLLQFIQIMFISPYEFRLGTIVTGDDVMETWNNNSKLYVSTINVSTHQIWDYKLQTSGGEDHTNQQIDVNEAYEFEVRVVSYSGWNNVSYVNLSAWYHDGNGTVADGGGYNSTQGGNYNMKFVYDNTDNPDDDSDYDGYCAWPQHEIGSTSVEAVNATSDFWAGNPFGPEITQNPIYDTLFNKTVAYNITFEFTPLKQFRYAPGETANPWNDTGVAKTAFPVTGNDNCFLERNRSWNFNISVVHAEEGNVTSVQDEFGVYGYTEISTAGDPVIIGTPGQNASTNSSNPYNDHSLNITIQTFTNGNYSLAANLSGNLTSMQFFGNEGFEEAGYQNISAENVWVRGGNRTVPKKFTTYGKDQVYLYGGGSDGMPDYEKAEVNGTSKWAGEAGDDGLPYKYPDDYNYTDDGGTYSVFNGPNDPSHYVEYTCYIPHGTQPGIYETTIQYKLKLEE
jgi:hypothetical protein